MASQLAPSSRHQFTYEGRLVYEWDQTLSDVTLYLTVPAGTRGKQLYCDIQPTSIKIGIQPNPPYLQVGPANVPEPSRRAQSKRPLANAQPDAAAATQRAIAGPDCER